VKSQWTYFDRDNKFNFTNDLTKTNDSAATGSRLNVTPSITIPITETYGYIKPKLSTNIRSYNLNNLNTTRRLLELARNGVLIIDLFPFALNYNEIRNDINFNQLCINFFSNLDNNYSLINRVFKFQQQEIIKNINTLNEVNAAIIAPPKTSHAIASFAVLNDVDFIGLRIGRNIFEFQENIDNDNIELYLNNITFPNNLIGLNGYSYPLLNDQNNNIVRVPHYSCNCYNETRGENPRALFIKNALGLP
jgi:hypothetical protein